MLVGKASHPVAEAHLQLACQARTHLAKKVAVPNLVPKKDAYYKVFSDLDCLGGKEGVQVSPGGTGGYTMHILAPRPGVYNGSVTFMAESGRFSSGFGKCPSLRTLPLYFIAKTLPLYSVVRSPELSTLRVLKLRLNICT